MGFRWFVTANNGVPLISPDTNATFYDLMFNSLVKWEYTDTFNPAAAIRNGKIVILNRAEDNSGSNIGKKTSRIGYAESIDGVQMNKI